MIFGDKKEDWPRSDVIRYNIYRIDESGDKGAMMYSMHAECSANELCSNLNNSGADEFRVFKQLQSGMLWLDMV